MDQLILVIIYAHRVGLRNLCSQIGFIHHFHFRNVNTTVLGYNLANLEVAVEWLASQGSILAKKIEARAGRCWGSGTPLPPPPSLPPQQHFGPIVLKVLSQMGSTQTVHPPPRIVSCGQQPYFYSFINNDGVAQTCWGDKNYLPRPVVALQSLAFRHVACGASHCVAVSSDGGLFTWGSNRSGQLGVSPNFVKEIGTPGRINNVNGRFKKLLVVQRTTWLWM